MYITAHACLCGGRGLRVCTISTLRIESGCLRAAYQAAGRAGQRHGAKRPFSYNLRPFGRKIKEQAHMSENPSAAGAASTPVETVIIGAGPVGLFQIFELGLLGISAHIIDSLAQPAANAPSCIRTSRSTTFPRLPICGAQELIDRLLEQAKPFQRHLSSGPGSDRSYGASRAASFTWPPPPAPGSMRRRRGDRGGRRFLPAAALGAARRRGIRGQQRPLSREIGRRIFTAATW